MPLTSRSGVSPVVAAALAIMAIAAATIAGAWFFQLVLDIQPCPLCLEQRYAYYTIIPLAALVAISSARGSPRGVLVLGLALLALVAFANAILGGAGNLLDQLDKVKVVPCDVVQWRFLGISLAGYNALISLSMAAIALWGIVRTAAR